MALLLINNLLEHFVDIYIVMHAVLKIAKL